MPTRPNSIASIDPAAVELRRSLAKRIHGITRGITRQAGQHATAIANVLLFHRTEPTACGRASYEPSLSIFVQGRKRIILGGHEYVCDASSFLLSSIDVPAQSQIVEASERTPPKATPSPQQQEPANDNDALREKTATFGFDGSKPETLDKWRELQGRVDAGRITEKDRLREMALYLWHQADKEHRANPKELQRPQDRDR